MAFHLHQRKFVHLDTAKYEGLLTPRMFCEYNHQNKPEKGIELLKASLENSFTNTTTRVNFVNKLYQCALGQGLPLKLKKLIACGEQDSGKTTWMYILRGE